MKTLLFLEMKKRKTVAIIYSLMIVVTLYLSMQSAYRPGGFYISYIMLQFIIQSSKLSDISQCFPVSLKTRYAFQVLGSLVIALCFGLIAFVFMFILQSKGEMVFTILFLTYDAFLFLVLFRTMAVSPMRHRGRVILYKFAALSFIAYGIYWIQSQFYFPMERYLYTSLFGTVMGILVVFLNYQVERITGYSLSTTKKEMEHWL